MRIAILPRPRAWGWGRPRPACGAAGGGCFAAAAAIGICRCLRICLRIVLTLRSWLLESSDKVVSER
eukprot:COSAG01_NODE_7799_length_3052_cov_4.337961_5_plen_67_part_00